MSQGICPKCGSGILFDHPPAPEERVKCHGCGDILKVVTLSPLGLEWAWEDLLEGPEYSVRSSSWRRGLS